MGGYGNLAEQKRWGDTKEAGGILKNEGYPPKYPPTVGGYRLQTWGDTGFFNVRIPPDFRSLGGVIFSVPPDFRRQGG